MQLIVLKELFCGSKYGSDGATITELASTTGGGNEKMLHTPALVKAVATVERSVVRGTVIIAHPTIAPGLRYGASKPRIDAISVLDILKFEGA